MRTAQSIIDTFNSTELNGWKIHYLAHVGKHVIVELTYNNAVTGITKMPPALAHKNLLPEGNQICFEYLGMPLLRKRVKGDKVNIKVHYTLPCEAAQVTARPIPIPQL